MANYKISKDAKADLRRIYRRGVREYGETQADQYYQALFDRFDQLAQQPYLYQAVDDIRAGYRRSVCGADSVITALMATPLRLCVFWGGKMLKGGFRA